MFFSGTTYYLDKRCSGGSKITDTTKCMEACNKLGISLSGNPFRNGRPCYQGGRGVCNQNGRWGSKSTMVCVGYGNLPSMQLLSNNDKKTLKRYAFLNFRFRYTVFHRGCGSEILSKWNENYECPGLYNCL